MDPFEEIVAEYHTAEDDVVEDASTTLASADEYFENIAYTYTPEEGLRAQRLDDYGQIVAQYQVTISVEEI